MIFTDIDLLRRVSVPTSFDECQESRIFELLDKELEASGKAGIAGVGLSAIQIGLPIQACIMRINYGKESKKEPLRINMINPIIEKKDNLQPFQREGCLSFPGIVIDTDRYTDIVVNWLDWDSRKEKRAAFHGLEAVVVAHEIDHLNGVVFIDRKHIKPVSIGRNSKCPECLKKGIEIKYKKCKEHFIS